MIRLFLKATWRWLLIVVAAILNGLLREKVLVSVLGTETALPVSGLLLAILVFLIALVSVPLIGPADTTAYLGLGIYWLVLTLSFEFLFGHCIAGKPWREILQVFNLKKGDLFIVVLLVTTLSPWLAAKTRGMLNDTSI